MKQVNREIIPLLNKGAQGQYIKLDLKVNEDKLRGLIQEIFGLCGTMGLEQLESVFKEEVEQLKEKSILQLENDGTYMCCIWEDRICENCDYIFKLDNGIKTFVPCYLCGFYDEEKIEEIRHNNRVKMILEGTWTYYPIRLDRVGRGFD